MKQRMMLLVFLLTVFAFWGKSTALAQDSFDWTRTGMHFQIDNMVVQEANNGSGTLALFFGTSSDVIDRCAADGECPLSDTEAVTELSFFQSADTPWGDLTTDTPDDIFTKWLPQIYPAGERGLFSGYEARQDLTYEFNVVSFIVISDANYGEFNTQMFAISKLPGGYIFSVTRWSPTTSVGFDFSTRVIAALGTAEQAGTIPTATPTSVPAATATSTPPTVDNNLNVNIDLPRTLEGDELAINYPENNNWQDGALADTNNTMANIFGGVALNILAVDLGLRFNSSGGTFTLMVYKRDFPIDTAGQMLLAEMLTGDPSRGNELTPTSETRYSVNGRYVVWQEYQFRSGGYMVSLSVALSDGSVAILEATGEANILNTLGEDTLLAIAASIRLKSEAGTTAAAVNADCPAAPEALFSDARLEEVVLAYWREVSPLEGMVNALTYLIEQETSADALAYRAATYRVLDQADKAQADFDAALALEPSHPFAAAFLARLLDEEGQSAEADQVVAEALAARPGASILYYTRGVLHYFRQEDDEALADFELAQACDPGTVSGYTNTIGYRQGYTLLAKERYSSAIGIFSEVLQVDAHHLSALQGRGQAYTFSEDYENALVDLNAALAIEPDDDYTLRLRAQTNYGLGYCTDAIADIDHLLSMQPEDAAALNQLKQAVLQETVACKDGSGQRNSDSVSYSNYFSDCVNYDYITYEGYAGDEVDFNLSCTLGDQGVCTANIDGVGQLAAGDTDFFTSGQPYMSVVLPYTGQYNISVTVDSGDDRFGYCVQSSYYLSAEVTSYGDPITAPAQPTSIPTVNTAEYTALPVPESAPITAVPDSAEVSAAFNQFGTEIQGLIPALDAIISANASDISALRARAAAYLFSGQVDLAYPDVEAALALAPYDSQTLAVLAEYYWQQFDFENAINVATEGIFYAQNNSHLYEVRGRALAADQHFGDALRDYERAYQLNPADISLYSQIGILEFQIGHYDRAVEIAHELIASGLTADGLQLLANASALSNDLNTAFQSAVDGTRLYPYQSSFESTARAVMNSALLTPDAVSLNMTSIEDADPSIPVDTFEAGGPGDNCPSTTVNPMFSSARPTFFSDAGATGLTYSYAYFNTEADAKSTMLALRTVLDRCTEYTAEGTNFVMERIENSDLNAIAPDNLVYSMQDVGLFVSSYFGRRIYVREGNTIFFVVIGINQGAFTIDQLSVEYVQQMIDAVREQIPFALQSSDGATPTPVNTSTPVFTPTPSNTPTITPTPSATYTPSITPTPTETFTPSPTFTPSSTYTASPTFTPTSTFTPTLTPTPTFTPTLTLTPSATFTPTSTYTPTLTPTATVVLTCGVTALRSTNLRSGPGTDFDILAKLEANQSLIINAQETSADGFVWYRSENGLWVRSDNVSTTGDCTVLPTASSGQAPELVNPPEIVCNVTTRYGVNLRTGPGDGYAQTGSRPYNDTFAVDAQFFGADGYIWWRVGDGSIDNGLWVREDLVTEQGACNSLPTVSP